MGRLGTIRGSALRSPSAHDSMEAHYSEPNVLQRPRPLGALVPYFKSLSNQAMDFWCEDHLWMVTDLLITAMLFNAACSFEVVDSRFAEKTCHRWKTWTGCGWESRRCSDGADCAMPEFVVASSCTPTNLSDDAAAFCISN